MSKVIEQLAIDHTRGNQAQVQVHSSDHQASQSSHSSQDGNTTSQKVVIKKLSRQGTTTKLHYFKLWSNFCHKSSQSMFWNQSLQRNSRKKKEIFWMFCGKYGEFIRIITYKIQWIQSWTFLVSNFTKLRLHMQNLSFSMYNSFNKVYAFIFI